MSRRGATSLRLIVNKLSLPGRRVAISSSTTFSSTTFRVREDTGTSTAQHLTNDDGGPRSVGGVKGGGGGSEGVREGEEGRSTGRERPGYGVWV